MTMRGQRSKILQGSLDLLILKTLQSGERHGYAIAKHLKRTSRDFLQVEEGSLYPALHRLEQRGAIVARWGTSESNRRAKYYKLTPRGTKQLAKEVKGWEQMTDAVRLVLAYRGQGNTTP